MEGKSIIYFYRDWWDFLEDLDMVQRGVWITYVMQYVNDGDEAGLMKYAAENLSPEEVQELTEMYQKYKD